MVSEGVVPRRLACASVAPYLTVSEKELTMHRLGWLIVGALLLLLALPATGADSPGKTAFLAQKCNLCHGVEAEGIEAKTSSEKLKGPDLTLVASRHDAEWIAKFVKREIQQNGADHKKEFKGSDEELQAIIDWLKALAAANG
jgi:mono/diheme cytochrome c family protein